MAISFVHNVKQCILYMYLVFCPLNVKSELLTLIVLLFIIFQNKSICVHSSCARKAVTYLKIWQKQENKSYPNWCSMWYFCFVDLFLKQSCGTCLDVPGSRSRAIFFSINRLPFIVLYNKKIDWLTIPRKVCTCIPERNKIKARKHWQQWGLYDSSSDCFKNNVLHWNQIITSL